MRISVFGLGYVGAVTAACLAEKGHCVVGVDPVRTKVDLINAGQSPIIEAAVGQIISDVVKSGRLWATDNQDEAILRTDLSFVCVGTPSQPNGNLDLTHIRRVCELIGIKTKSTSHNRHPQHDFTRHDASDRDSELGGEFGKESRRRLRNLQ